MFEFDKYEGLGNDFVLVTDEVDVTSELAQHICDRRRGVGADGVLRLSISDSSYRMEIWNADGSQPEMCGNGLRCAALWAKARTTQTEQLWQTDAGPHHVIVESADHVTVHMAVPSFEPRASQLRANVPFILEPINLGEDSLEITVVSMGNPHVIVFGRNDERSTLGPALQALDLFEHGVNVSFAEKREGYYELHVLERGAGWTEACGTAACALVATLLRTEQISFGDRVELRLPGGPLTVSWPDVNRGVVMRGPARHVFSGHFVI